VPAANVLQGFICDNLGLDRIAKLQIPIVSVGVIINQNLSVKPDITKICLNIFSFEIKLLDNRPNNPLFLKLLSPP
jgi:hypothetical protein